MHETLAHGLVGTAMNVGVDQNNNQIGCTTTAHNHHHQQQCHNPHEDQVGSTDIQPWHQTYTSFELLSALMQPTATSYPPPLLKLSRKWKGCLVPEERHLVWCQDNKQRSSQCVEGPTTTADSTTDQASTAESHLRKVWNDSNNIVHLILTTKSHQ
uniref:Uncharacterized protein n=1 Tax=Opuntia streptacantha TaxID=393608 RepID=A0A7C9E119_OPUST